MQTQFEFNKQWLPQNILDIPELGNFAIEATNDQGFCYYLILRTSLGISTLAYSGPVIPDVELLPSGYTCNVTKIPYKEDKLIKTINFWLNEKSKALTDAKIIEIDDAIKEFRDVGEYLRNYSEENS